MPTYVGNINSWMLRAMDDIEAVPPSVSIVIPVYRDYCALTHLLQQLIGVWDAQLLPYEVIIVDGQDVNYVEHSAASDSTLAAMLKAHPHISRITHSPPQRAGQMNAGAQCARGDILWFLHADSQLPTQISQQFQFIIQTPQRWGRFNVWLDSRHYTLKLVAFMINWRSRLSAICTGDQGIFIEKSLFDEIGGFANQPLMEDIELSKSLKARSERPYIPKLALGTSSRKWLKEGVWRTIFLMWRLRYSYWRGASPEQIHQRYYRR